MPVAAYVFKKTVSANLNSLLWAAFPLQSFIRPIKVDIIFSKYFSGFKKTCHRCRNKGRSHTHPKPQLRQLIHCEKWKRSTGSIFHARQMLPQSSSPFLFFFSVCLCLLEPRRSFQMSYWWDWTRMQQLWGQRSHLLQGLCNLFVSGRKDRVSAGQPPPEANSHPEAVSLAIQQAPSSPSPNTNYIHCRKESGGICP